MNPMVTGRVQQTIAAAWAALARPRDGRVLVGVSGGADSLCLLHALHALADELGCELHVAHLDHGLRAAAVGDAAWVQALCTAWGLPCTVEHCDVAALGAQEGLSIEDAARRARYGFFARKAERLDAELVAVAHTADDQAETVLLHLLRGAGLEGLCGMAALSPWPLAGEGALSLWRPLLTVTHEETLAYCAAVGLEPRDDASNHDTVYRRNRLRHELLPLMAQINPSVTTALCRTARIAADEDAVLQALVQRLWSDLAVAAGNRISLARSAFGRQPAALQRRLLRRALGELGAARDLAWEHIEQARQVAVTGATGAQATLPHGLQLRVDYDRLWIEPQGAMSPVDDWPALCEPSALPVPGQVRLGRDWLLTARVVPLANLPARWDELRDPTVAYLDADRLQAGLRLRTRRPGDRLRPLGLRGSQTLKELLIDAKVPAACRSTLPLVTLGEEIVWVVGVRGSQAAAVTETTERVCVLALVYVPEEG